MFGFGLALPSRRGPSGPSLGPEIALNGEFNTADNWTLGSGWAIAGGLLSRVETGGSSSATQTNGGIIAGETYQVRFPVISAIGSNNQIFVRLLGSSNVAGPLMTGVGTYFQNIVAPSSPTGFSIVAIGGFAGVIPSFSIRRVLG